MALPEHFSWETDQWGKTWLKCHHTVVANVSRTVFPDGRWIANVNRHDQRVTSHPYAYFRSQESAMRSVERWVHAHAERLLREIETGARRRAPEPPPSRAEKQLARKMRD
ncbi:hypothetical protein [Xanthomonas rydalmerensis]|uniref:Uncharacterized protein n=1 Tax=Xanthomonas rydalmerensis TaxID=3046274 RepID=A0ABZ0JUR1_9XANT|nr:hypothetical protein [Xanthomonas sp. DM-2023]WOS42734.1 hypothetical protein QN243_09980 [Xanthomonas sp. DM-2023]WOS46920.1 hypothetical protein QN242_09980 [Xanthomonas sp. DM-2023]WOS51099.1 hypothetical protein QN240_09980 [Xanthomonas sp. DM-2023]WOS55280.1 hypothetical protein QN244_09980 [Xanthomonas sp. DM-2023]WOS59462.1 hypothetical protein QN245_09980 [Xanthomonas sp. DM-2023]